MAVIRGDVNRIRIGNYLCGKIGMYWTAWSHHTFFLVLAGISLAPLALLAWQYRRLLAVMNADRPAPAPRAAAALAEPLLA
jgi:hypothetical protein